MQKTILCYGDSNTWGYVPTADYSLPRQRYTRNERWPGVLQELLGNNFYVIEEGLNSRTTNIDHVSPPDRNGKTYLAPCLYSHSPIDLVILDLGGNDTKTYFNRSAEQIKDGLAELIDIIQTSEYGPNPQTPPDVLIIPPSIPLHFTEKFVDENGVLFLQGSVKKTEDLVGLYNLLAKEKNCYYLDISTVKPSDIDGVHYDKAGHKKCAELIRKKVEANDIQR